jgi:hypothetical protein
MNDILRQREPRVRDQKRLDWLKTQPCVVCGCGWPKSEAAHIRVGSINHDKRETGMAEKASDKWTVSLCFRCHREQHAAGDELKWWASKGLDPFLTAIEQEPK